MKLHCHAACPTPWLCLLSALGAGSVPGVAGCGEDTRAESILPSSARFDRQELDERLEIVADQALRQNGVRGFVLRVDAPCLGYSFEAARGFADADSKVPMTIDHAFWIASTTKTMTAVVILHLVESGLLTLDDTLIEHLPAELVDRVHVLDGRSQGHEITIGQLIGHTSGLWDHASEGAFFVAVLERAGNVWSPRDLVEWAIANGEPVGPPGEQWHYSDLGYLLAGLVIESVTGEPVYETYRRLIFDPLQMTSAHQGGHEARPDVPVAPPLFGGLDIVGLNIDPSFDWGGGGVIATATDLNRFYSGLFSGQLLSDASVRLMLLGIAPEAPGRVPGRLYGLGILRPLSDGEDWRGHSGFWGSWAGHSLEHNVTVAFSTSQSEASRSEIQRAIFAAIPDITCEEVGAVNPSGALLAASRSKD